MAFRTDIDSTSRGFKNFSKGLKNIKYMKDIITIVYLNLDLIINLVVMISLAGFNETNTL